MIRNFGASGVAIQPQGLDLGLGGSNIKSVQRGFVDMTGVSTLPITVSSINTNKSILRASVTLINSNTQYNAVNGVITNSTTITLSRNSGTSTIGVYWELIEFNNVKSLQTGTLVNTSADVTISSINPSKSTIVTTFTSSASTQSEQNWISTATILNNTTIHIIQASTATTYWQVIEFN